MEDDDLVEIPTIVGGRIQPHTCPAYTLCFDQYVGNKEITAANMVVAFVTPKKIWDCRDGGNDILGDFKKLLCKNNLLIFNEENQLKAIKLLEGYCYSKRLKDIVLRPMPELNLIETDIDNLGLF